jgi:hypothetical protein
MKSKEEQLVFLGHQAEYERQLARLYKLYQDRFPYSAVWPFLVKEERKHEDWLKQIMPKVQAGEIYFYRNEFTIQAISQMIDYLKDEFDKAEKEGIDLMRAVSVALYIEDSSLEKNIFTYLDSDSPKVQEILDSLSEDTKKHRKLLQNAREELKKEL